MKIAFVTQWFPPENATPPALIADGMAARGHDVHVLTGFPNYPTGVLIDGYRVRPYRREVRSAGVTVHRAPLYPSHDRSAARRGLNYLSFAVGASAVGVSRVPSPDVWLVYSSPATAALPAMLRRRRTAPVSLIIQDLWPDSVTGSGFLPSRGGALIERSLDLFTDATYRSATAIGVISPGMKRVLEQRGVPGEKIHYTPNWVSTTPPVGGLPEPEEKSRLGLPTHGPVFLYAGNLGQLQALSGLVDAFARVPSANLVLIGHGVESDSLQDRANQLPNVHVLPPVGADEIGSYLQAADILVVSLSDTPLLRVTMPSKVQASMAAGRPILVHGAGDVADVVNRARCGETANPSDPEAVTAAIRSLSSRLTNEAESMGQAARHAFEAEMSESAGLDRLESMLNAATRKES